MRVLFLLHNGEYYSGANLAIIEVINSLVKKHDITPVFMLPCENGTVINYCKDKKIEYYTANYWMLMFSKTDNFVKNIIKYPLLGIRHYCMINEAKRFAKLMSTIDIIYSNSSVISFGVILAKKYSIPHVWHVREFCDLDHGYIFPLGKSFYYSMSKKIPCSYVFFISKCLYDSRKQYFTGQPCHLIYDDVDIRYDNYSNKRDLKSNIKILIAGDVKQGKGQLVAVTALGMLKEKGHQGFDLYLAGKIGDNAYKKKIDTCIIKYNIKDNVHFLGHVKDMNKLRDEMHVGIVASTSEAFGRVTVEGMLSNMAMVGNNSGATPEIITDRVNGLIYDGSPESLATKIVELEDENFRNSISNKGYHDALKKYVGGKCSDKIWDVLQYICNKTQNKQ